MQLHLALRDTCAPSVAVRTRLRRAVHPAASSFRTSKFESSPGGRCRILRQRPARPDHFRDRAQRALAAILALTVVGQTSIEPKFSPQFEFDKPPSEDSNSDVSEPAPQCAVMDDVGCGQRSILPGREDYSPETTGRSASVQIIPNIAEGSKR